MNIARYEVFDGVYCYPNPVGHAKYARGDTLYVKGLMEYRLKSGAFNIEVCEIGPGGGKIFCPLTPPTHAFGCWLDNFRDIRGKEPSEIQIRRALRRFAYNTPLPLKERLKIFKWYKVWHLTDLSFKF